MSDFFGESGIVKNCFYENMKDQYPHKPKIKHKDDDKAERFAYVYNKETGRHEGKFCTPEELKNIMI